MWGIKKNTVNFAAYKLNNLQLIFIFLFPKNHLNA